MSSSSDNRRCERQELVASYALAALDRNEAESMRAHLRACAVCQREYQALSSVTDTLSAWRAQPLPQSSPLWNRLVEQLR